MLKAVQIAKERRKHVLALGCGSTIPSSVHSFFGGNCIYPDVYYALHELMLRTKERVMVIDVGARQARGIALDAQHLHRNGRCGCRVHDKENTVCNRLFTVDMYNKHIWPSRIDDCNDGVMENYISANMEIVIPVQAQNVNDLFFHRLRANILTFMPTLVIYVSGPDCIAGNKYGGLSLEKRSIIDRDVKVFEAIKIYAKDSVPIVYCVPNGYPGYQTDKAVEVAIESVRALSQNFQDSI